MVLNETQGDASNMDKTVQLVTRMGKVDDQIGEESQKDILAFDLAFDDLNHPIHEPSKE